LYQLVSCRVASIKHVEYLQSFMQTHHATGLANYANETAASSQSGVSGRRNVITYACGVLSNPDQ
jgi:hypothetical protein